MSTTPWYVDDGDLILGEVPHSDGFQSSGAWITSSSGGVQGDPLIHISISVNGRQHLTSIRASVLIAWLRDRCPETLFRTEG